MAFGLSADGRVQSWAMPGNLLGAGDTATFLLQDGFPLPQAISATDATTGADAVIALVLSGVADAASGADTVSSLTLLAADGLVSNDAVLLLALSGLGDVAHGADGGPVDIIFASDAATGTEGLSIAASLTQADAVTGSDALLAVVLPLGDVVVASDTFVSALPVSASLSEVIVLAPFRTLRYAAPDGRLVATAPARYARVVVQAEK